MSPRTHDLHGRAGNGSGTEIKRRENSSVEMIHTGRNRFKVEVKDGESQT